MDDVKIKWFALYGLIVMMAAFLDPQSAVTCFWFGSGILVYCGYRFFNKKEDK